MIVGFKEAAITKTQEREMINMSTNRRDLQDELIARNFGLVLRTAHKYKHLANFDDLVQEGSRGLTIAADRFDTDRPNKFNSYAIFYIRKYILGYINDEIKTHTISDDGKTQVVSMQATISNSSDDGAAIEDIMKVDGEYKSPSAVIEENELNGLMHNAMNILSEQEKYIIQSRLMNHVDKITLKDVGSCLGYSISNIKAIENRALRKIKMSLAEMGINAVSDVI